MWDAKIRTRQFSWEIAAPSIHLSPRSIESRALEQQSLCACEKAGVAGAAREFAYICQLSAHSFVSTRLSSPIINGHEHFSRCCIFIPQIFSVPIGFVLLIKRTLSLSALAEGVSSMRAFYEQHAANVRWMGHGDKSRTDAYSSPSKAGVESQHAHPYKLLTLIQMSFKSHNGPLSITLDWGAAKPHNCKIWRVTREYYRFSRRGAITTPPYDFVIIKYKLLIQKSCLIWL